MSPREARMLVAKVLRESGLSRAQLARDADISVASLNAWTARGRASRDPRTESLEQLAAGLERRAVRLQELAAELRQSAVDPNP